MKKDIKRLDLCIILQQSIFYKYHEAKHVSFVTCIPGTFTCMGIDDNMF